MWGLPQAHRAASARQDNGGGVWVPQSMQADGMLQLGQQGPAATQAAAGPEALPLVSHMQSAQPPPAVLNGMLQLDGGLLQPAQSLPTPGAGGGAGGAAQPAATSSAMTTEAVDKQAIAREKNRLAQRRFREKERQKAAEAEAQADAMRRQLMQLRLENERLQIEHTLLEKLLVVRDAILSVVVQLDALPPPQGRPALQGTSGGSTFGSGAAPSVTALLEDPAALQAASQQLAAALGELPSLEQMEAMVGQMGGSSGSSTGGSGGSPSGSQAATSGTPAVQAVDVAAAPPLSAVAGAAAASGVVVEKSRLQEAVPMPSDSARREAEALDHVECLYEYWRQWRMRLREVYEEAKACDFSDEDQLVALDVQMREPVEVIWAACYVQPKVFNLYLTRCLPPLNVDMSAEWTRIAEESLPLLRDTEITVYRRAIQRYTKQAAIAAVGVRPWVQRLQALVAAQREGPPSMTQMAEMHTQVREVATRLQRACTEQYLACLAFMAEVGAYTRTPIRCKWILSGGQYAPDYLAILSEIVRLHQQQRQQQRQRLAAQVEPAAIDVRSEAQPMQQDAAAGTAADA